MPGDINGSPKSPSTPSSSGRFSFNAMAAALPKTEPAKRGSPSNKPSKPSSATSSPSSSAVKKILEKRATGPPPRSLPNELFVLLSDALFRQSSQTDLFHNDRQLSKCFVTPEDALNLGLCVGDVVQLELEVESNEGEEPTTNGILLATLWPSSQVPGPNAVISDALLSTSQLSSGSRVKLSRYSGILKTATSVSVELLSGDKDKTDPVVVLAIKSLLSGIRFVRKSTELPFALRGDPHRLAIRDVFTPDGSSFSTLLFSSRDTELRFIRPNPETKKGKPDGGDLKVDFSSIGGLDSQIAILREMVLVPLTDPSRFTRFGIRAPRGVLLTGPSGTGKTLLARAAAAESGAHVVSVKGGDVLSKYYGETEARLRAVFEEAVDRSPTVVFIDEIDTVCGKRDDGSSELEKRVVASLLTLMDGVSELRPKGGSQEPARVVVIGATNRPGVLDEALRRPGRFDREIEVPIPTPAGRLEILQVLLRTVPTSLARAQLSDLSAKTHGYVGADLAALVREAGLRSVKRHSSDPSSPLRLTPRDFDQAFASVRPSAMREILLEVPKVKWTDIGGQSDVKQKMKEAIEWPLTHPQAFARLGIRPPKGILMYGPPGCSKTLMAKALATESGLNFLAVKGPELFSKWVGESEKAVREVFRKARAASPSIVFFDEIDALATTRSDSSGSSVSDRVLSQLLTEMDGIEPLVNVTVVAATNRPDVLDPALLRPGRLDRILYVGPPDMDSRREIFRISTKKMAVEADVDVEELASRSEGLSGAECVNVCQEAAMLAMEEDVAIAAVGARHFDQALREVRPRITDEMIAFYERFREGSKANVI